MSDEADFHLLQQQVDAAKLFADAAMRNFETNLNTGSPEQIERRRVEAMACVEAWLDAVALMYWKHFESMGVDPDRRHLWKRPR